MHYVKYFDINGTPTKQVACIELQGKPNAATEGYVGALGIDVTSPLHDVYKCVAVKGSIYTWELLSSGMSIMSAKISRLGEELVEFSYDDLRTPDMYVVKSGDLILDKEGYLYQIESIYSTYCVAKYCGAHIVSDKSAYAYAVEGGYTGTEAEFRAKLAAEWVPVTRKVNGKALREDVTLSASDVGASASGHKHSKSEITDFPTSMTPSAHSHTKSEITDFSHNHDDTYYTETEIDALLANGVKIQTGTYKGVNGSIENTPATINFNFTPKLVFLHWEYATGYSSDVVFVQGGSKTTIYGRSESTSALMKDVSYTISTKQISMSAGLGNQAHSSVNSSGVTYRYIALGEGE